MDSIGMQQTVTPFVGVWIETAQRARLEAAGMSHPSWVCGLKLEMCGLFIISIMSHPSWVCGLKPEMDSIGMQQTVTPFVGVWIETAQRARLEAAGMSHPSWVCGLKLEMCGLFIISIMSHPSWVCGLKPSRWRPAYQNRKSHPSWVCGLKHVLMSW